jgi:hypothetical protein
MSQAEITPSSLRERAADHMKAAKVGTIVGLGALATSFLPENPIAEFNSYGAAVTLTLAATFAERALEARRDATALENQA